MSFEPYARRDDDRDQVILVYLGTVRYAVETRNLQRDGALFRMWDYRRQATWQGYSRKCYLRFGTPKVFALAQGKDDHLLEVSDGWPDWARLTQEEYEAGILTKEYEDARQRAEKPGWLRHLFARNER